MSTVAVVLNGYRRTRWFEEQLVAIENQTHKPSEIFLWQNYHEEGHLDPELASRVTHASCNSNLGVWSRFAFALNCQSDYICIFDDDTIPGSKWLENCVKTYESDDRIGVLGTVGISFGDKYYTWQKVKRIGWVEPNEETTQVDMGGHAWFFHRNMLSHFWRERPKQFIPIVGEDMHLSHMVQKYGGKGTFCPPHPANDKEMWGSLKGAEYGHSEEGISMTQYTLPNGQRVAGGYLMGMALSDAVDNGYCLLSQGTEINDANVELTLKP